MNVMWEKRILMCRPEFYKVDYEINYWMNVRDKVDTNLALEQWTQLHHLIIRCGGYVEYIQQEVNQPDMVFTANAGIVKDKKFFASTFAYPERKDEELHWVRWSLDNGYEVSKMPSESSLYFEGAGDCLKWGNYLISGYGFRSSENSGILAGKRIGYDEALIKQVKLIDKRFYHLDTCFCPLNSEVALVYPQAAMGVDLVFNPKMGKTIVVDEEDAIKFACNSVVIGQHVIMPSGCENTANKVVDCGFKVHLTDMSEFIKAGGACKCLTLELP